MKSPLSGALERVDRENYESFRSLVGDLRRSIDLFAFDKAAGQAIDMDIPASRMPMRQKVEAAERMFRKWRTSWRTRSLPPFQPYTTLLGTKELTAKLKDAMNGMDAASATSRDLASMGTGKCAEALLLACKLIHNQDRILCLRNATYSAETQRLKTKDSHAQLFYRKARTAELVLSQWRREKKETAKHSAQALSQLRHELDEKTKQCGDLAIGIKAASNRQRRLSTRVSDMASKPIPAKPKEPELPPKQETAVADVKQMVDSERKKTKRLQEQVKYFKKKLDAYEPDSSKNVNELQAELDAAKAEASASKKTADELVEKLRCQICMDRQRDTAFACGHTCCKPCSVKWEKCTFNCVSESRQKPVKFTFPIYFN